MKSCDHPRAGPGGGRLDAGLANFCLCHGRELLAAFPLPGDDAVDPLGECSEPVVLHEMLNAKMSNRQLADDAAENRRMRTDA